MAKAKKAKKRTNVDDIETRYLPPEKVKTFIVRAPKELIKIVDEISRYNGYWSRNEFMLAAIKEKTNELLKKPKQW